MCVHAFIESIVHASVFLDSCTFRVGCLIQDIITQLRMMTEDYCESADGLAGITGLPQAKISLYAKFVPAHQTWCTNPTKEGYATIRKSY